MRRRPDDLLPLEEAILGALQVLRRGAGQPIHGFALAKMLADDGSTAALTAHGTLYKALSRLETRGLLASEWEDAAVAAGEKRPRRRLYRITGEGARVLAAHRVVRRSVESGGREPAWETP